MAIQQTPQPPKKSSKAGMGCLGCGCLFIIVLFLVFAGLVGGSVYMMFKELNIVSSPTAEVIAAPNNSDDVFASAQKKLSDFNQDVGTGKTSTLTLSSDEINALIQHNVSPQRAQAQLLVNLDGNMARLQGSIPSNQVPIINMGVKDRYFNVDGTTGLSFNPDTKEIELDFHKLQLGDITVPDNSLASLQATFSQILNQKLRQNTAIWNVLQVATKVTIENGQFVVQTK